MADSGMGGWASFMLGRMSVQHDENIDRMMQRFHNRNRPVQNSGRDELLELLTRATVALEHGNRYSDKLEGQIAQLKAQLAEAEHNVALYQTGLQAGQLRITELERHLEASRDHCDRVTAKVLAYIDRYGKMSDEELAKHTW